MGRSAARWLARAGAAPPTAETEWMDHFAVATAAAQAFAERCRKTTHLIDHRRTLRHGSLRFRLPNGSFHFGPQRPFGKRGGHLHYFVRARAFAAPATVAALALGMTVPAASRVLIPASRPAQRFTPSEATAARPAVLLAPVTARTDEHLAPASGTEKQSGIVHCSPWRGGLDDPRSPGNTALGAVRKCGSGRSLGHDRQVSTVRGCVGLLADSDLTPTHERRHRRYARRAPPLAGSIGSGGNNDTSQADAVGRFSAGSLRPAQSVHEGCSPNNGAFPQPPTNGQ